MIHSSFLTAAPGRSTRRAALGVALAAVALLALDATAHAQLTRAGDADFYTSGVGPASGVIAPSTGAELLLTTENADPAHDGGNVSGFSAVPVAALANYLYLGPGDVQYNAGNPGTEGTGVELALTATGPTSVTFFSDFVTSEPIGQSGVNPDFSLYTITPVDNNGFATGATQIVPLGSAGDAAAGFTEIPDLAATSPFSFEEGYKPTTFLLNTPGNYVIGFAVADANTFDTQSGLFVSDLAIVSVPEPGVTAILLLAGAAGVAWMMVRRRAQAGV